MDSNLACAADGNDFGPGIFNENLNLVTVVDGSIVQVDKLLWPENNKLQAFLVSLILVS